MPHRKSVLRPPKWLSFAGRGWQRQAPVLGFLSETASIQKLSATVALFTALTLVSLHEDQVFAARSGSSEASEKTIRQAPSADDDVQSSPTTRHKGVITPPKTGDEGIYTQAPNPNAGTNEEVIPPPGTPGSGHPNVEPR
jgi:hypothetical protein